MSKILIVGDSWGCGEWGNYLSPVPLFPGRHRSITHLGLEQYLIDDGHKVTNLSIGGASNNSSFKILSKKDFPSNKLLQQEKFCLSNYDYIFWFQTDPWRDVGIHPSTKKFFKDYEDLLMQQNNLLKKTYQDLNNLNNKIYCLGGCSKINEQLIIDYKNLICVIPSITELLIPGYQHPNIWFTSNYFFELDYDNDLITLEKILKEEEKMYNLRKSLYFQQDTGHPDRHGHRVIFEYLKKVLSL